MTRRMFLTGMCLPACTPVARQTRRIHAGNPVQQSLPIRGWTYWHQRFPRGGFQTSMQQPGRRYRPLGLLTVPGHPAQLVWRHQ